MCRVVEAVEQREKPRGPKKSGEECGRVSSVEVHVWSQYGSSSRGLCMSLSLFGATLQFEKGDKRVLVYFGQLEAFLKTLKCQT